MSTTSTGRHAEYAAAKYLKKRGFEILDMNWRTRWCEIDVIAKKKKVIYFVEVKYRKSDKFGRGLEYITSSKLKQMKFAAEFWVSENDWTRDYRLSGLEVTGENFKVTQFVESI